jgi:hypothetical protein
MLCRWKSEGMEAYDARILDTPILILRYGDTAATKNKDTPILQNIKNKNKNNNKDN